MLVQGLWVKMPNSSDKLGKILIRLNNYNNNSPIAKTDYLKVFPVDCTIRECPKIRGPKTINTLAKTPSSTKTMPKQTKRLRAVLTNSHSV